MLVQTESLLMLWHVDVVLSNDHVLAMFVFLQLCFGIVAFVTPSGMATCPERQTKPAPTFSSCVHADAPITGTVLDLVRVRVVRPCTHARHGTPLERRYRKRSHPSAIARVEQP